MVIGDVPLVNSIQDFFGLSFAVNTDQIPLDPVDQVVLEPSLDELVENIWG